MEKKSPSPVTSVGTATKSPLQGSAFGNVRPVSPSKKCRLREKKSPPRSGSSSSSPSTQSFKTATGSRRSRANRFQEVVSLVKNYLEGDGYSLLDDIWENNDFNLVINFVVLRKLNREVAYKLCENNKDLYKG
ncbi:hypothetical protein ZWY2020_054144 [Hordeum vulgare]|nr:hypothetical protein ZWY2020_054144 [Hordeum vulgare]